MKNVFIYNTEVLSAPLAMSIEITNKCMLKCLHCYNRSGDDLQRDELSDDELLNLTKYISKKNLFSFCFCGGEPLIKYDLVLKMCAILKESQVSLNMVSNGWLIDKEKVIKLKKAGMGHIQISIDGKDSFTHDYMRGVPGAYDKAINALNILEECGIRFSVAFCPTDFNINGFPELVGKIDKFRNLLKIRVQPLMNLGRGSLNDIEPSEEQYRKLVKYIKNYNLIKGARIIEWGDPVDHLIRWNNLEFNQICYSDIKSDGTLLVSSYLPIAVGNLRRHSYEEYWEAGLGKSWKIPVVKELVANIDSISSLGYSNSKIPKMFFENNIEFDLIDDNVFDNLDKFTYKYLIEEV